MRTAPLLTTIILLAPLAACGEQRPAPSDRVTDPVTDGPAAAAAGTSPETATPRGLAAAVLTHLGDAPLRSAGGGVTDLEGQLLVGVDLRLAGARNLLHVEARDPAHLPGDDAVDTCPDPAGREGRQGTFTCRVLTDGTVVEVFWVAEGMSDGNPDGATAMATVHGPSRSLQLIYESFDRDTALTADTITAIAEDPLVAWTTSAASNAAGERITGFREHHRQDRDGEAGYDEETPDGQPEL